MQLGIGPHLEETEIEQYSMGTLPHERVTPFEEHFLICESCQDRLLEMEAFINAVRSVSPKLRAARSRWSRLWEAPRLGWATAAAMSVAALLMLARAPAPGVRPAAIVQLEASRGVAGLSQAKAVAGQPVSLQIDLTEIRPFPSYRLEIVDSVGKAEGESLVLPEGGKIVYVAPSGLPAGRHYVRLYGSDGALLREFALWITGG